MSTKEAAKADAKADKKKPVPPAPPSYKFGIAELEGATGLKPASIRVALRESTFKKADRVWGWNTKGEFDEVVKYLKNRGDKAPKAAVAGKAAKADAKPAKADAKAKSKKG